MLLQSGPGLGLVALGLIIALFIILANEASGAAGSVSSGSSMSGSDRRTFIKGIVSVGIIAFLAAVLGGTAVDQLSEEGDVCALVVNEGETYTVGSGDTESFCRAEVNGTLHLNGELDLTG